MQCIEFKLIFTIAGGLNNFKKEKNNGGRGFLQSHQRV